MLYRYINLFISLNQFTAAAIITFWNLKGIKFSYSSNYDKTWIPHDIMLRNKLSMLFSVLLTNSNKVTSLNVEKINLVILFKFAKRMLKH